MRVPLLAAVTILSSAIAAAEDPLADFVGAARRGDGHAVHKRIERDPGAVRLMDGDGLTALHWAAARGHWRIVAELVAAGAPVNAVADDGAIPLHEVCHHDRPDMVALLLEAGADPGRPDLMGWTPLHVAARRGRLAVAEELLEAGADPNAPSREGWTPLHVASLAGWPGLAELLIARGADPKLADNDGRTPSQVAITRPVEITVDPAHLDAFVGLYTVASGHTIKIWRNGDALGIRGLAPDRLYPVGDDAFFCRSEPWRVRFHRASDRSVRGIEVVRLRQTVTGARAASPQYLGSAACRSCHQALEDGDPGITWLRSRHGHAYWRLGSDWSLALAHFRPQYADVEAPNSDARCLLCHVTARQDDDALLADGFRTEEGVGCESCHGPGSEYADAEVMADRDRFIAAGGRIPDAETCRSCHRNPDHFDYATWWPKIAHGRPQVAAPDGPPTG